MASLREAELYSLGGHCLGRILLSHDESEAEWDRHHFLTNHVGSGSGLQDAFTNTAGQYVADAVDRDGAVAGVYRETAVALAGLREAA